jgi:phosphoenolpyruvate carboxykinase (GTP)
VNWFRKGADGKFLWPGFGDNSRVLKWICERVEGSATARKTPIGNLPTTESLDLSGLNLPPNDVNALTSVDCEGWKKEVEDIAAYYAKFDGRVPNELAQQLTALKQRVGAEPGVP